MRSKFACVVATVAWYLLATPWALAQCPASFPVEEAPPPGPLPLFPADN
jgi:hypothetical protein